MDKLLPQSHAAIAAIERFWLNPERWRLADNLLLIVLMLSALGFAQAKYNYDAQPYEDAVMILRYSDHLAEGHGIVWNVGEQPVDGATDFLFMVVLAGAIKPGMSAVSGVLLIDFACHLATIALVYLGARKLWGVNRIVATVATAIVVLGPGTAYIAAFFATPFFAFFCALSWYFAIAYVCVDRSTRYGVLFAVSALAAGLARPEGVLLSGFIVVAVIVMLGLRPSLKLIVPYLTVFLVVGGTYFLWRWSYFGYPLPNPYYKKGGGKLYPDHLKNAISQVNTWTFPFSLAFLTSLFARKKTRLMLFLLLPVLGFTAIWILISPEMNWLGRFQYAALPIFALSCPPALAYVADLFNRRQPLPRLALYVAATVIMTGSAWIAVMFLEQMDLSSNGLYTVATILRPYADRGYTIATTEAGVLPYVSGWKAIDTWGLNDSWIAHHGVITADYLDRAKPEVIMADAVYSESLHQFIGEGGVYDDDYGLMVTTIASYARDHHYVLAGMFGAAPNRVHLYYVKPDSPDSQAIISQIRSAHYVMPGSSTSAQNYAAN